MVQQVLVSAARCSFLDEVDETSFSTESHSSFDGLETDVVKRSAHCQLDVDPMNHTTGGNNARDPQSLSVELDKDTSIPLPESVSSVSDGTEHSYTSFSEQPEFFEAWEADLYLHNHSNCSSRVRLMTAPGKIGEHYNCFPLLARRLSLNRPSLVAIPAQQLEYDSELNDAEYETFVPAEEDCTCAVPILSKLVSLAKATKSAWNSAFPSG